MISMWMVLVLHMDSYHGNTFGHLLQPQMKLEHRSLYVPVLDQTSPTQELYLPSLAKTTSVRLEAEIDFKNFSMLMIHSGMVRDVGVPVLAAPSTINHGSANKYHSQQQTILS